MGVSGNGTTLFTAVDQPFNGSSNYTVFAVGNAATSAIVNQDR